MSKKNEKKMKIWLKKYGIGESLVVVSRRLLVTWLTRLK